MRLPKDMEEKFLIAKMTECITFDSMVKYLRSAIGLFPDKRTGKNSTYCIEDVALGAFSIFFTQSPSFLAFLFHTVLEVIDEKYRLIRSELPARKTFFDDIRALTRYIYFESWDAMLLFMIRGLELNAPDTS